MHDLFVVAIDAANAKWLHDDRLGDVWQRLDEWLSGLQHSHRQSAADTIVGALALPAWLIPVPGQQGVATSAKRAIRAAQTSADDDLKRAAKSLLNAAALIDMARSRTTILPDAARTIFHLFTRGIPAQHRNHIPSYYWTTPDTVQMLRDMANELETSTSFDAVPGFQSQKMGWRDWLREAEASINEASETYGRRVLLREVDWVKLAQVATGDLPGVSRDSVRAARRRIR